MHKNQGVFFKVAARFIFIVSGVLFCLSANGQEPVRVTQSENKIQDAFMAARLESSSGHYDKAYKILDSLAKEHRSRAMLYYEMALISIEQKNYIKADEKLQRALSLEKNNFWFLERMAYVQTELSRLDKAIDYYIQLIGLNPKSAKYYDITADLLLLSNRQDEAINQLIKKEEQVGYSENNTLKIIDIATDIHQYDMASVAVEKLINRKNPKLLHLKMAAEIYKKMGQPDRLGEINQKILAIDPNDMDVMLDNIDKNNGQIDESTYLVSLQPLMQNRSIPSESKLKELLPFVENHAKDPNVSFAQALIHLCELIANAHPEDPRVHAMYGDVLMNDKKEVQAIRQYERTLEISKNNFLVWEQLMYGLEFTGDFIKLGETAEKAINYFPNQAISYYFVAVSLFQQGHSTKAKEYIEEAKLISGRNPQVLSRVMLLSSKISLQENDWAAALKSVETAIDLSSGLLGVAWEWKGDLLLLKAQKNEAKISFQKALDLMPDSITIAEKLLACQ